MYCGKLLSFLSFSSTSYVSSNIGSKGKVSVGSKLCVEGMWMQGGHFATLELPTPHFVQPFLHSLYRHSAGPSCMAAGLVGSCQYNTYQLVDVVFFFFLLPSDCLCLVVSSLLEVFQ